MNLRIFTCLITSIIIGSPVISQQYEFHSTNPFGIQLVNSETDPIVYNLLFSDRDMDGDQDLFLTSFRLGDSGDLDPSGFSYTMHYQENIGTSGNPEFGPKEAAFDTLYIPDGYFYPSCGDLNGDGLPDFIAMGEIEYYSEIQHLVIYLSDNNEYIIHREYNYELDAITPYSTLIPSLADLDADGDLDILISGSITTDLSDTSQVFNVLYAKNIGTPHQPEFLGWFYNPYNVVRDTSSDIMQVVDIDGDGDMDIISLAVRGESLIFSMKENISDDKHRPQFSDRVMTPYGMPLPIDGQYYIDFSLVDIDNDQDLDLFVIELGEELTLLFYENTQCVSTHSDIYIDICEGYDYEGYIQSGIYIDTLTTMSGCDSIRTLNLNVNQVYDESLRLMKCEGDTIILGDHVITSSGNYVSMLTTLAGCDSIINLNVIYYVIDASVTNDENILSVLKGYDSYQWLDCVTGQNIQDQTSATFSPDQSGSYAVHITTATGCEKTSDCIEVIVSSSEEIRISKDINIFPNPTKNRILIENNSTHNIDYIQIMDFKGRIIKEIKQANYSFIDVSALKPGGYLVLIRI